MYETKKNHDKSKIPKITEYDGENCAHYCDVSSQAKAEARLCALDEETQDRIAKKYYGGFRPWAESTEETWR